MRASLVVLLLLICCHTAAATQPPEVRAMAERLVPKVRVEDDAAFFAAWNLDYAGMEKVKEAVQAGDLAAAKAALKGYFLQRRSPKWRTNHWQMPTEPRGKPERHSKYREGEEILAHRFGGHQFGERIDWNCYPKTRPDGSPDTEFTPSPVSFNHASNVLGRLYWFSLDERYAKEFADEDRPNMLIVQADPVAAQVLEGQEGPVPRGWQAPGGFEKQPAPVAIFEQASTDRAHFDTVLYPLEVGQTASARVERMSVSDAAGGTVGAANVCALRIDTDEGTDYYINDLRQREIGPANGRVKIAGPVETDARAVVVRIGADGKLRKASAVAASFVKLHAEAIWQP